VNAFTLFALIGAIVIAAIGWRVAGALGLVIGLPVGLVVGFFGLTGLALSMGWLETRWDQLGLRRFFGPFWRGEYDAAWENLKTSLHPGSSVTGVVVKVRYHGAFVDVGNKFPGLINTYEVILRGGKLPSLGETIHASVKEYDDDFRAVVLTANEPSSSQRSAQPPADA
jgi:hypothetical protein